MALNDLETFTTLFNSLKGKVNDSPATLSWLSEQKPGIRRHAYEVGLVAAKIKKVKAAQADHHQVVPGGFATAWKNYESKFEVQIVPIVVAENEAGVKSWLAEIEKVAEARNLSTEELLEKFFDEINLIP